MEEFEEQRPALFGAAYRILGTRADAEDALQDAWLRWQRADRTTVRDVRGYLFTLVTNTAIDQLRRARTRREAYVGPWLPEPLITAPSSSGPDMAELADTVSIGLLVVLETLDPVERAVFVLHEAFGFSHSEIAAAIGRTERAVRQLAYRARKHVEARRPRRQPSTGEHRALTQRFLSAAMGGDLDELMAVLAPDVEFVADADGRRETPLVPLRTADVVARYLRAVVEFWPPDRRVELVEVNGGPGALVTSGGRPFLVLALEFDDPGERIRAVRMVLNPDKLP